MHAVALIRQPYLLSSKGRVPVIPRIEKDIVNRNFYSTRWLLVNKASSLAGFFPTPCATVSAVVGKAHFKI